jgi:LysM repeat protein
MHVHGRSSAARLLAPLALVAFAAALVMIVLGSGVLDEDTENSAGARNVAAPTQQRTVDQQQQRQGPANYTIKANDTLTGIAARTGTTVERLQELNPELDPQGLVAGQVIKLRE